MRHLKSGRKFGRTSAHRKALFRNLVTALIRRERIQTTLAKAKELRGHVEKTITLGKKGTLHARRQALTVVKEKDVFLKLFGPLSERYANRNGGYTRVIKIGNRRGDDAPMAFIELVDREEEVAKIKPKTGKKTQPAKEESGKKVETKKKEAAKEKAPAKKKEAAAAKKQENKKPEAKKAAENKPEKAGAKKAETKKAEAKNIAPKKKKSDSDKGK